MAAVLPQDLSENRRVVREVLGLTGGSGRSAACDDFIASCRRSRTSFGSLRSMKWKTRVNVPYLELGTSVALLGHIDVSRTEISKLQCLICQANKTALYIIIMH